MKLIDRLLGRKKRRTIKTEIAKIKAILAPFKDEDYAAVLAKKPLAELETLEAALDNKKNPYIQNYLGQPASMAPMVTVSAVGLLGCLLVMPAMAGITIIPVVPALYVMLSALVYVGGSFMKMLGTDLRHRSGLDKARDTLDAVIAPKRALQKELETGIANVRMTLGEKTAREFAEKFRRAHGMDAPLMLDAPAVKGYLPPPKN